MKITTTAIAASLLIWSAPLARAEPLPVLKPPGPGGSCPHGWAPSGTCPFGWREPPASASAV